MTVQCKRNSREFALLSSEPASDASDRADDLAVVARDVHRSFSRALQSRIIPHGVSIGQWLFLCALWEEDGLTQRELSRRVGMMEPTTVIALNGMERRGLVQRVRNAHDRRKMNIHLTPHGAALRHVLLPSVEGVNEQAVQGISAAEVAHAIDTLRKVLSNLRGLANDTGWDELDEVG